MSRKITYEIRNVRQDELHSTSGGKSFRTASIVASVAILVELNKYCIFVMNAGCSLVREFRSSIQEMECFAALCGCLICLRA